MSRLPVTNPLTAARLETYRRMLSDAVRGQPIWRLRWSDLPGTSGLRANGLPYTGLNALLTGERLLRDGRQQDPRFFSVQAIAALPGSPRLRDGAQPLAIEHWTQQPFWQRPGLRVFEGETPVTVQSADNQGHVVLSSGRKTRAERLRVRDETGPGATASWDKVYAQHGKVYAALANVYHAQDIDPAPPALTTPADQQAFPVDEAVAALRKTGLRILRAPDARSSSYDLQHDVLRVPLGDDASALLEGLVRAALHPVRQGRDMPTAKTQTQVDRETLAAVFGACLLSAKTGAPYTAQASDAQLIAVLRDDPAALFHAASMAWRAVSTVQDAVLAQSCERSARQAGEPLHLVLSSRDGTFCIEDLRTGETVNTFQGVALDPQAGRFVYARVSPHAREIYYLKATTLPEAQREADEVAARHTATAKQSLRAQLDNLLPSLDGAFDVETDDPGPVIDRPRYGLHLD
jgi:antirestriction protein ArdC